MTPLADPKGRRNTHDIVLTHGTDKVGLVVVNSQGEHSPRSIDKEPINQQSLKFYSNQQKHSDMEPPWQPVKQDNWQSGFGYKHHELNTSGYFDSSGMYSLRENELFLGGFPQYCTGLHSSDERWYSYDPGESTAVPIEYGNIDLNGGVTRIATPFTASASYTPKYIHLVMKKVGTPTSVAASIFSDSGGSPNTALMSGSLDASDFPFDNVYEEVVISIGTPAALTSGTTYWVVIIDTGGDATDYWSAKLISSKSNTSKKYSDDAWSNLSEDSLLFRIVPAHKHFKAYFTEHKRALIAAINYDDGTKSEVYISGDAGTATGGSTTTIVDGTKSWTTNEFRGRTVMITGGTGSIQRRNYAVITSNNGTTLTVTAMDVGAAAGSEYVILNSDKWTSISPAGGDAWAAGQAVTDMLGYGGAIYFAHGDATSMTKLQRYSSGGAWVNDYDVEDKTVGSILAAGIDTDGRAIYIGKRSTPEMYRAPAVDATGTSTAADLEPVTMGLVGDGTAKINGMVTYGEYGELTVFTQNMFYTYFNDQFHEKRVPEMRHTQDDRNGTGQTAAGVYLYFTWHNAILRYYDSNLDSIGPNNSQMEMHGDREGTPTEFIPYAGGLVFAAINAGKSRYSSVVAWNGSGFMEMWRAPMAGVPVYNVYTFSVEGDAIDRLYISWGSDILWIPLHLNPPQFNDGYVNYASGSELYNFYPYKWSGWLESPWITLELYDVEKFFYSVALNADEMNGNIELWVDYKVDDDTSWTAVGTGYTNWDDEVELSSTHAVSGKRIKLRIRIDNTTYNYLCPQILSVVLDALIRMPNKYTYNINYRSRDHDEDLQGNPDDYRWANDKQNKLEEFAALAVPVYCESSIETLNGKYVFVETPVVRLEEYIDKTDEEYLLGFVRLIEVT